MKLTNPERGVWAYRVADKEALLQLIEFYLGDDKSYLVTIDNKNAFYTILFKENRQ